MAISEWWTNEPVQRYWMEITNRLDLGGELKAPHFADDNRPKWGYELVRFVKPGDIVLHWYTRRGRRLIGFSVVSGPPESKAMKWQSRGTSGRASLRPLVDEPAWTAPLSGLTYFTAPLTREDIQPLRKTVLDVQASVAASHGGDSMYFPFYEYGGRDLRATQSYLAKFPAELIHVFGLEAIAWGGGDEAVREESQAAETLMRALAEDSSVVKAESSNTEATEYERTPGRVIVRRGEAQLVGRFLQTIATDKATRLQLAVGFTDLYDQETGDLIEAKVSAEHRYVRQALGQLLDYAAHCTQPINRLTALFPAAPRSADIRLLHLYGIDCLYWAGDRTFHRLPAPPSARLRIRTAWTQPIEVEV